MAKNLLKFTALVVLIATTYSYPAAQETVAAHPEEEKIIDEPGRVALDNFPLIDGHNDLPWILRFAMKNQLKKLNLYNITEDLDCSPCKQTNLHKLRAGKVGAQFWVAYAKCDSQFKDAVEHTLEQIDVIKRFINIYSDDLEYVTSADGILKAFENKKIGSLIALEGGHSIANQLSILRMYYELGVRYMTLTHLCSNPWADASPVDTNSINNITDFGKRVVWEMNRLGMLVDLSHVSHGTMANVLKISKAPVIFSHSSAHAVHAHHRNVRDDVLQQLKDNKGIIMVNFFPGFIGTGNPGIKEVAKHIEHIVSICGIDCVGIGADYSGIDRVSIELEDASKYPDLFDFLKKDNPTLWTIKNLEKLAGRNFIRVFKEVEKVRDSLRNEQPDEELIPEKDLNSFAGYSDTCKTIPIHEVLHL